MKYFPLIGACFLVLADLFMGNTAGMATSLAALLAAFTAIYQGSKAAIAAASAGESRSTAISASGWADSHRRAAQAAADRVESLEAKA